MTGPGSALPGEPTRACSRRTARRVGVLLFLGTFLLQMGWSTALPPFRGIDEFDHAYRAADVALGDWHVTHPDALHGRGDQVVVPRSIVVAASPVCAAYSYTGRDNCHPIADKGHGLVTVASAAASYNPVFYWVIGTPARLFQGADALYAMRVVASLLCAGLVGLAGWTISIWARTRAPLTAMLLTLTPVAVYSTSLGAPNGVEMIAGLTVWVGLMGLSRVDDVPTERALVVVTVASAVLLSGVRALGPVWLAMILSVAIPLLGRRRIRELFARHRRLMPVGTAVVGIGVAAGTWWTWAAGTNRPDMNLHLPDPLSGALSQLPLWVFQSVAAFPTRNEPAPAVVYVCGLVVLVVVILTGFLLGERRLQALLALSLLLFFAVPFVLTLRTISEVGTIWQGRYALPFSLGIPVLASLGIEERPSRLRLVAAPFAVCWVLVAVAQLVSVVHVQRMEAFASPITHTPGWTPAPTLLVAAMTLGGVVLWYVASRIARDEHVETPSATDDRVMSAVGSGPS